VIALALLALVALGWGIVAMLGVFGKDAVAGRQEVGWVKGKGNRW
jgi:hypothetical protein